MDGTPFGRYRLIELIGRGGMGEVWRAYDTGTDRIVAVKVLPENFAQDPVFAQRFKREAHAAAQLNNAHVIAIHDYGEIDGRLFVDMRLINGHDLQAEINSGPLAPARAVAIIEQIASALNAAHRTGLIHRDVKPSNILLDEDDLAYLIDFGIARANSDTGLTGTGVTIGTWAYMAPERFSTDQIDARTDVYALACVLHECLTGEQPFPGSSFEKIAAGHMFTPAPRPSVVNPSAPTTFDEVIAHGLAKDPDHRYATTKELAAAARGAITTPIPRPVAQPPMAAYTQQAPTHHAPAHHAPTPTRQAPVPATMSAAPPHAPPPNFQPPSTARPPGPPATPTNRGWWQRKSVLIPTALILTAAVASAVVLLLPDGGNGAPSTATSKTRVTSAPPESASGQQETLPFTDLGSVFGLAVDAAGNVYVIDTPFTKQTRVLALSAGSTNQSVLPFTGLADAYGIAAGGSSVYVADYTNSQVLALAAGASTPSTLPFTVGGPFSVAVDGAGTVYVGAGTRGLLALATGASTQTSPFPGVKNATEVAVDGTGSVYVVSNYDVLELTIGSPPKTVVTQVELGWNATGMTVGKDGTVYVADGKHDRVVALAPGSNTQTVLPFTGLDNPTDLAVDANGAVYVADYGNNRVLKLPALQ